jgi:F-type H+-transporting ATPase subunit delta
LKSDVIARRYAKALYDLGIEENLGQKFLADLNTVVGLMTESDEFKSIMESPLYDIILKKKILGNLIVHSDISKYIENFLYILLEKDRFQQLPDVLDSYYGIINEVAGKATANVISAVELNEAQQRRISDVFSRLSNKQINIETTIDHSIIGGLVVDVEGMVYDGSIKSGLFKFKESLKGEM